MAADSQLLCIRCRRPARPDEEMITEGLPELWEGSPFDAICPGCQNVEWHPYCTSIVDPQGQRVDVTAMPIEEMKGLVEQCGYIDLDVAWIDGEDVPASWSCPQCGGSEFSGVHRP